jgi:hypothetical protein
MRPTRPDAPTIDRRPALGRTRRTVGRALIGAAASVAIAAATLAPPADPAWAEEPLVVSGTLVDPQGTSLTWEYFRANLWDPDTGAFLTSQRFQGADFALTAPGPGTYRVHIVSDAPTWSETYFGDTPFPWHAEEVVLDGSASAAPITIELLRSGSISGTIDHTLSGLAWNIEAAAYLIDPETGRELYRGGDSRDFAGEYVAERLPAGQYVVRFSHRGPDWSMQPDRLLTPAYYDDAERLEDAVLVPVESDADTPGIDVTLHS